MKLLFVGTFLIIVASVLAEDKYTNKYDDINLDEILKSGRLFKNYLNCLMGTGLCTNEGQQLKTILPEALKDGCSKCSEKQRANAERVIKFLTENKKAEWDQLKSKYDPTGEYYTKYEPLAKERGIQ